MGKRSTPKIESGSSSVRWPQASRDETTKNRTLNLSLNYAFVSLNWESILRKVVHPFFYQFCFKLEVFPKYILNKKKLKTKKMRLTSHRCQPKSVNYESPNTRNTIPPFTYSTRLLSMIRADRYFLLFHKDLVKKSVYFPKKPFFIIS